MLELCRYCWKVKGKW